MAYSPHTHPDRERDARRHRRRVGRRAVRGHPATRPRVGLELPAPRTEQEVRAELSRLADRNRMPDVSFLGDGAYRHLVPAVVDRGDRSQRVRHRLHALPARGQPGHPAEHLRVPVARLRADRRWRSPARSHYDGATATAEAALMACRLTHRDVVAVSTAVNPEVRRVLATYCSGPGIEVVEVPADLAEGRSGLTRSRPCDRLVDGTIACLVAQQPNFFGGLEPMAELGEAAHAAGAQFVAVVEPTSLAVLAPPGDYGADIVAAEGQPLGIPIAFGGPYVGLMAACMDVGPPDARPPRRRHARRRGPQGLRAHPPGARAAHPPREGRIEHLHQPGALRPRRDGLPLRRRTGRGCARWPSCRHDPGAARRGRDRGGRPRRAPLQRPVLRRGGDPRPGRGAPPRGTRRAGHRCRRRSCERDYPELPDCLLLAATELTTDGDVARLVAGLEADR